MLKLGRVTKVKVLFLVVVFVFHFDLFQFSAAILEKGLLIVECKPSVRDFPMCPWGCETPRERERERERSVFMATSCRFSLSSCVVVFEYCTSFSRVTLRL